MLIPTSSIYIMAAANEPMQITLKEAQERALENNLQYKLQDSSINDALESYYDADESNKKQSSTASHSYIDYFNKPINLEVSLQTAENKVKSSRFEKEDIKRTSDFNVFKVFISIKKAQYELENATQDIEIKYNEYETAKGKYSMDMITASTLRESETSYKSALEKEEAALKSLQKEIQTLNRYIGRELTNYNITPIINLSEIDISTISLDKLREDYIKNKENLYTLSLNAEMARRKYDLTKERYEEFVVKQKVSNSWEKMQEAYDDATLEYENARKNFEDATIDLDMSLNTSYDALKAAADSITDLYEDIEMSKNEAEIARFKYDMELITKSTLDKAVMGLETLNNKLKTSIADLNLQYETLMMYSK
jgi:outer membrane protein TolC